MYLDRIWPPPVRTDRRRIRSPGPEAARTTTAATSVAPYGGQVSVTEHPPTKPMDYQANEMRGTARLNVA